MNLGKVLFLFLLIVYSTAFSQVKIGDDVSTIDDSSILELESSSKVLVLTRITNAQMLAIRPLEGGIVYNTDTNCVHYFNGLNWQNLCSGGTNTFSFEDNNDGTFTINYADGSVFTSSNLIGPQGEKGDPGEQGPAGNDATVIQQQVLITANNGQRQFTTPLPIVENNKIQVFRNGVQIAFSAVNANTIQLEGNVSCFQNDQIRIVQVL